MAKMMVFETAFSSFRKISPIGEGGSGHVVKVEDESKNLFAIKYLSPENVTSEKASRFKNELSFCAYNDHQNIIKVLDWGHIELKGKKCPFYVMPCYSSTLRGLIKTRIPSNKVLPLFSKILDGVEAAHLLEVWHRDLKPENVLVENEGYKLVIADFGIAHFAEPLLHTSVKTPPDSRLANFQYAAPEQRTKGGKVNAQADIYALGLILNEMFTQKVPHGVGFQKIHEVDPNYRYIDDLVDSMLNHSQDKRPTSISIIKQELIARQNDFVTIQKLSELKKTVIPVSEIDDPLILDPPKLVDASWDGARLNLKLSRQINPQWIQCFNRPGSYQSILGKGPEHFQFRGDTAFISSDGRDAKALIGYSKDYIEKANQKYKTVVETAIKKQKAEAEEQLKQRILKMERLQAINKELKV